MAWTKEGFREIDLDTRLRYHYKYEGHMKQTFEMDEDGKCWVRWYLVNNNGKTLCRLKMGEKGKQKPIPKNSILYVLVIENKLHNNPEDLKPPKDMKRKPQ